MQLEPCWYRKLSQRPLSARGWHDPVRRSNTGHLQLCRRRSGCSQRRL